MKNEKRINLPRFIHIADANVKEAAEMAVTFNAGYVSVPTLNGCNAVEEAVEIVEGSHTEVCAQVTVNMEHVESGIKEAREAIDKGATMVLVCMYTHDCPPKKLMKPLQEIGTLGLDAEVVAVSIMRPHVCSEESAKQIFAICALTDGIDYVEIEASEYSSWEALPHKCVREVNNAFGTHTGVLAKDVISDSPWRMGYSETLLDLEMERCMERKPSLDYIHKILEPIPEPITGLEIVQETKVEQLLMRYHLQQASNKGLQLSLPFSEIIEDEDSVLLTVRERNGYPVALLLLQRKCLITQWHLAEIGVCHRELDPGVLVRYIKHLLKELSLPCLNRAANQMEALEKMGENPDRQSEDETGQQTSEDPWIPAESGKYPEDNVAVILAYLDATGTPKSCFGYRNCGVWYTLNDLSIFGCIPCPHEAVKAWMEARDVKPYNK